MVGMAPTRKRPSHELTGIGRFPHLYSESGLVKEMATSGGVLALAVATLFRRAACRRPTWAYWNLSQSILFHPLSGWPFMHTPHKRLLPEPSRIPHHQYALGAPRLPESNYPSGPVRPRWARKLPQLGGSGSHVPLLAPGGPHEVTPWAGEWAKAGGAGPRRRCRSARQEPRVRNTPPSRDSGNALTFLDRTDRRSLPFSSPGGRRSFASVTPLGVRSVGMQMLDDAQHDVATTRISHLPEVRSDQSGRSPGTCP